MAVLFYFKVFFPENILQELKNFIMIQYGREYFKDLVSDLRAHFGIASSEVKIHGSMVKQDSKPKETKAETKASDFAALKTSNTAVTTVKTTQTAVTTTNDPLDDPNIEGEISNNILVIKTEELCCSAEAIQMENCTLSM